MSFKVKTKQQPAPPAQNVNVTTPPSATDEAARMAAERVQKSFQNVGRGSTVLTMDRASAPGVPASAAKPVKTVLGG
jgi:hypothetical protein